MLSDQTTTRTAFSMIELVMVVLIMGIIVAIAAPRFVDAGSGRRLASAKKVIERDINSIQLRAKATGKIHTLAFYPANEIYLAVEGTNIRKEAVVLMRELDEEPFSLDLARTNIGGDQNIVISAFGKFEKAFAVSIADGGVELLVSFEADGFTRPTVTETDSPSVIKAAEVVVEDVFKVLDLSR